MTIRSRKVNPLRTSMTDLHAISVSFRQHCGESSMNNDAHIQIRCQQPHVYGTKMLELDSGIELKLNQNQVCFYGLLYSWTGSDRSGHGLLGSGASHGGPQAAVELEHGELVEQLLGRLNVCIIRQIILGIHIHIPVRASIRFRISRHAEE